MVGGVAAAAAARSWPFRVYSFPSEPSIVAWNMSDNQRYFSYTVTYVNENGIEITPTVTAFEMHQSEALIKMQKLYNQLANMACETYEHCMPLIGADPPILQYDPLSES